MRCQLCNKEMDLPFRCSYCEGYFCTDHKLPENHQCPEFPKLKSFPRPIMESKRAWQPEPEPTQEPQKPKQKLGTPLLVACIILIVVGGIVAYASYDFGYDIGYDFAYSKGYDLGFIKGHDEGHNAGYNEGYVYGNLSGYQKGYETGFDSGNLSGSQKGYETGYVRGVTDGAGRGYNIRDPTYEEALNFVASDHTEQHEYSANYTCLDFTANFKMNAFKAGYKCGFVYIEFPDSSHAIVAFNTTDHGLVFIEPQRDDIVTLIIGQPYWDRAKYEQPSYDDTIVRFVIVW